MEVLAAAVRERSLAGAARSLGITPSAASQAVGALEAQAGTPLLERRARGVVPTAAGERLALQAEAVLAQLAAAEAELSGDRVGAVRIAAFATAVAGLLPQVLRALGTASPDGSPGQRVEILELEPAEARAAVRSGEVDLALVNHDAELSPDMRGPWRVVHVIDEPVLAVLPATHPLARARTVDLARLTSEDWIMQAAASPCQELTLRACAAAGFAPSVSATCADYRSIVRLIEVGHGVSLVPRLALAHLDCSGVVARRTRLPLTRRVNALVTVERADTPAVRRLLTLLRDVAAEA
jgi:DNA-binding transcriptional LysR family regulator